MNLLKELKACNDWQARYAILPNTSYWVVERKYVIGVFKTLGETRNFLESLGLPLGNLEGLQESVAEEFRRKQLAGANPYKDVWYAPAFSRQANTYLYAKTREEVVTLCS